MNIVAASFLLALNLLWPLAVTDLEHAFQIELPDLSFLVGFISSSVMLLAIYQAVEDRPDKSATFPDFFLFGWATAILLMVPLYGMEELGKILIVTESPAAWILDILLSLVLVSLAAFQFPILLNFLVSSDSKFSTMFHIHAATTLRSVAGINIWGAATGFFLLVKLSEVLLWEAWAATHTSPTSSILFATASLLLLTAVYFVGLRALCREADKLTQ